MKREPSTSVTVVIPTLGERDAYLRQAVQSVISQRPRPRLIVVAPRSAESARALCHEQGVEFVEQRGTGLSAAVNQGWQTVDSPYMTWLGDDDLLAQGALNVAAGALARDDRAAMVYGRLQVIDGAGRSTHILYPGRIAAWFMRYGRDFVPQPGSLYRSDSVRAVGLLDEGLKYAMDLDLFLRLSQRGRVLYLKTVLASFRRHPGSLTVANPWPGREAAAVRARYHGFRARRSRHIWEPLASAAGRCWAAVQFHLMRDRTYQTMDRSAT